jgi:putative hemolysin
MTIVALDTFPLLPVLSLLAMAAFFSASETALFSLSRFQLRQIKQKTPEKFQRIQYLLDRPAALVATVLLGNELTNVLISNIVASFYEGLKISPLVVTALNLLTVMPLIMILGEITPKVLGAKANISVSTVLISPLWWFYRLSFPVRFLLENSVNFITRPLRKKIRPEEEQIREEDIRQLLEEGKKKGAFQRVEQNIIENLFDIDDDHVIELATPLNECLVVHQEDSPKSVIERIKRDFSSRIPVRGEDPHQIVGILYAKDLLKFIDRDEQEMKVRDLMKEPLFVSHNMKAEVLFRRFRQMKRHIAIVEDKSGRSVAAITMEDILEQMFGELWMEAR